MVYQGYHFWEHCLHRNALVAKRTQILTATLQNLVHSLSRTLQPITANWEELWDVQQAHASVMINK